MRLVAFAGLSRLPSAPPSTVYDLHHVRLGALGAARCPAPVPLLGAWPQTRPWLGSMALGAAARRLYRGVEAAEWTRTGVLLVSGRGDAVGEESRLAVVRREVPAQAVPVSVLPEPPLPGEEGTMAERIEPIEDRRGEDVGGLPSGGTALSPVPEAERRPYAEAHPAILSAYAVEGPDEEPRLPYGYAVSYKLVPLTETREAGAPVYVSICGATSARATVIHLATSDSVDAVDVYRTFPLNLTHGGTVGGFPVPVASAQPVWLSSGSSDPEQPAPEGYFFVDRLSLVSVADESAFTRTLLAQPASDVPAGWGADEDGQTDVLWCSTSGTWTTGRILAPCFFADYAERSVRATFTAVPGSGDVPDTGTAYVCCEARLVAVGATSTTTGTLRLAVRLARADGTPLSDAERWSASVIAGATVRFATGNGNAAPQRSSAWIDRSGLGVFPGNANTEEKQLAYANGYSARLYDQAPTADASFPGLLGVVYVGGEAAPWTWRTPGARHAFASGSVMLYGNVRTPTKAPAVALVVGEGAISGSTASARVFDACLEYATPSGAVRGPRLRLPSLHAVQIRRADAERALLLVHEGEDRVFARLTADADGLYRMPGLKAPYTWASALMNLLITGWSGSTYDPDAAPGEGSTLPPYAATLDEPDAVLLSAPNRPREVTYDQYRLPGGKAVAGLYAARQGEEDPVRVYDFYTLSDGGLFACSRVERDVALVPVSLTEGATVGTYKDAHVAVTDHGLALATRDGRVLVAAGRSLTDITSGLVGEAVEEPLWSTPPLLAYHVRRRMLYALTPSGLYGYAFDRSAWMEHHATTGTRLGYVRAPLTGTSDDALDGIVVVATAGGADVGAAVAVASESSVDAGDTGGGTPARLVLQHTTETGEPVRLVRLSARYDAAAGTAAENAASTAVVAGLSTDETRAAALPEVDVPLYGDDHATTPRGLAGTRYRVAVEGFERLRALDVTFSPA